MVNLLVSLGSMFGRSCHFNVNETRHYSNEFVACVGDSSTSRKGASRDVIESLLKQLDSAWFHNCAVSGFASAEAIIDRLRDTLIQSRFDKKTNKFIETKVPGNPDKRLCVWEPELGTVFSVANKPNSNAASVLRNGWDGKPLNDYVKGKNQDGISNSVSCREPHLSLNSDITPEELIQRMPEGAESNGLGNRFLYVYVYRLKLCSNGGPDIDWSNEVAKLCEVISFASKQGYVALTESARTPWARMYPKMENRRLPGLAGKMTSRGPAHVRRLALIFAMLDLSPVVDTRHLYAAKRIWDYCEDSAQFVFNGTTKNQVKFFQWLQKQEKPVTWAQIRDDCYKRNEKSDVIKTRVAALIRSKRIKQIGDTYQIVK
jgi:hypothetical protein